MADNSSKTDADKTFSDLGINRWLVKQCEIVRMKKPTPVQINLIPEILKGKNCIGCGKTGSGKTAAFALPILQRLAEDPRAMFALVLTPTRELACQIKTHFDILGSPLHLKCAVVIGGKNHSDQITDLTEKPHVVIATPGRLADHIRSGTELNLNFLQFLVLDEADRLLEEGFREDLKVIYSVLPPKRQVLLFSATFTEAMEKVAEASAGKSFVWTSPSQVATVDTLDERYVLIPPDMKNPYLVHIVDSFRDMHKNSLILIFVPTCKYCQILGYAFVEVGLDCVILHSGLSQQLRLSAMNKFKSSQVRILIATDVGSRGLDIPAVDLVINHNVPFDPKTYIHRVGRTARAGQVGLAVTLVTKLDLTPKNLIHAIEAETGRQLVKYDVDEKKVGKIAVEVLAAVASATIRLDEEDFGEKKEINKRKRLILEGQDPDKLTQKNNRKKSRK